jgi:riboflavin kinase/FMN adenylyltransferase
MIVINGIHSLKNPLRGSVVTVGVFDGVHIGHRKVISHVVSRAKELGLKSVLVTFDPHPVKVLTPQIKVPSIMSLQHRIDVIKGMGIDILIVLRFTKSMARISPEKFVETILMGKLGMREMYVGENFFFGRGALAGPETLQKLSDKLGFKAHAFKPVMKNSKVVSSSLIRNLIINGDIKEAANLLGRHVSILGTVVHGAAMGRLLGFRTANLNPHHEAIPPTAVYAMKARLDRKIYDGVLNIGTRPTFHRYSHELEPTVEAHIFGFNKDIYGKDMEVIFISKMRDQFKFSDKAGLMGQIARDVAMAKRILKRSKKIFTK